MKNWLFILIFFIVGCGFDNFVIKPTDNNNKFIKIKTKETIMLKRIGESFDIKVSVENATEVVGLNAWITYDPTIIEVVDSNTGTSGVQPIVSDLGFLPSAQLLVGLLKSGSVEQPGTLVCGYVSIPAAPTTGTGDCFTVRFRAKAAGVTDLVFAVGHLNLQDENGDIPTDGVGDNVTVPVNAVVRITVL